MPRYSRGFDLDLAAAHLGQRDRKLGRWIDRIGPLPQAGWRKPFDTVDVLARAILYQQLSGKAAATIVGRVEAASGSSKLTPAAIDSLDETALRACGVSGNKARALRDLAARAGQGEVPAQKELAVRGERWGPYRTLAGLYLWRICDAVQADSAAKGKPKVKRSQD